MFEICLLPLTQNVLNRAQRYDATSFSGARGIDPLSSDALDATPRAACLRNQRLVKLTLNTDSYGYELSWVFRKKDASGTPLAQGPNYGKYEDATLYRGSLCVDIGFYEFEIQDA